MPLTKEFPLKRYLAFAYDTYYPGGGLADCLGWSDDLAEALAVFGGEGISIQHMADYRFVLDTQTGDEHDAT